MMSTEDTVDHDDDSLEMSSTFDVETQPDTPTPVPYLKIFPLLVTRFCEGIIYSCIFPYINEWVRSLGVPEQSTGVWSAAAVRRVSLPGR